MERTMVFRPALAVALCLFSMTVSSKVLLELDGSWEFRFEEGRSIAEVANPDFVATDTMTVPSCFDTLPRYLRKRGTALYRRSFVLEGPVLTVYGLVPFISVSTIHKSYVLAWTRFWWAK